MPVEHVVILVLGGLAAGFVAGIIGVGGGIIFAPVLYFYFEAVGVDPIIIAPLVIGTSLLCTTIAAAFSAWFQDKKDVVEWPISIRVGLGASLAIVLMTRFVTTREWFDGDVFKVVFSVILLGVVFRMLFNRAGSNDESENRRRTSGLFYFLVGSAAGTVSSIAGVGGGVVLVPSFHQGLGLSMIRSIATSSGTIIFISMTGVVSYMLLGGGISGVSPVSMGYVDIGTALLLAVPSILTVRMGVQVAHRVNREVLRKGFAVIALIVVVRLLLSVLG